MPLITQTDLYTPTLPSGGAFSMAGAFVPGENPDDFFALLHDHFRSCQPSTAMEAELVTDVVIARWLLLRRERACASCESNPRLFDLLHLYRTRAERHLKRALKRLQASQKEALREQKRQRAEALQKERFERQRDRLAVQTDKLQTAATTPERILAVIKPDPALRRRR